MPKLPDREPLPRLRRNGHPLRRFGLALGETRGTLGQESDGDTVGTKMAMPFTLGMWKDSEPTVLTLEQGDNKLTFWRVDRPQYGFTVKSFTVKPVKLRVPRPW